MTISATHKRAYVGGGQLQTGASHDSPSSAPSHRVDAKMASVLHPEISGLDGARISLFWKLRNSCPGTEYQHTPPMPQLLNSHSQPLALGHD